MVPPPPPPALTKARLRSVSTHAAGQFSVLASKFTMDSPPCAIVSSYYTNTFLAARRTNNLLPLSEAVKWVIENEEYVKMSTQ